MCARFGWLVPLDTGLSDGDVIGALLGVVLGEVLGDELGEELRCTFGEILGDSLGSFDVDGDILWRELGFKLEHLAGDSDRDLHEKPNEDIEMRLGRCWEIDLRDLIELEDQMLMW